MLTEGNYHTLVTGTVLNMLIKRLMGLTFIYKVQILVFRLSMCFFLDKDTLSVFALDSSAENNFQDYRKQSACGVSYRVLYL